MNRKTTMKMIPLAKQSKKKQKQYHAQKRKTWDGISPVTRVVADKKKYDRNREKQAARRADREKE